MSASTALAVGVTGANGFVGRAVCAALRSQNMTVRPFLRQRPGRHPDESAFVVGEVGPDTDWQQALQGLDVVVHCAAHVHQMGDGADTQASAYQRVNTDGTLQLARCAALAGVRRLVFISSVKVLGECTLHGHPFRHDTPPAPQDPYGQSKWAAEQGLWRMAAETGLEVVVIRPPLVYGQGVGANFAALIRLVRSGWPLPLGLINNRRSMVGLRNLVDLICRCTTDTQAAGQTLLVSDGEDLSTPDLVLRLANAMGCRARIWRVPVAWMKLAGQLTGRSAQIDRLTGSLQVDISRTCELLNWHPPHTVDEELALAVGNAGHNKGIRP